MDARRSNRSRPTTLSRNIRLARQSKGLSQNALAAKLGVSDLNVISKWERGVYRPSEENLIALAMLVSRDVAWFYTDHEPVAEPAESAAA